MAIDQAGKNRSAREVNRLGTSRELLQDVCGFTDGFDLSALDPDDLIGSIVSGAHVENFSGVNCNAGRRRWSRFLRNCGAYRDKKNTQQNCKPLH